MNKLTPLSLLAALAFLPSFANAGLVTVEFNDGDSLSDWTVDRAAPAGFEIVNNELVMSIDGTSSDSSFHKTKGMKLDIGRADYLAIDIMIDSAWEGVNRFGGIWATAFNLLGGISGWPILEFQGDDGIQAWDNNGWHATDASYNPDEFNNFAFQINDFGVEYLVNGNVIYTDPNDIYQTAYFGNVILNAKDAGFEYNVRYDNLSYRTVPEPTTLAIFGLALLGLTVKRKRS
ncbi:PEP-CTERM sorting domain-containing protein [Alginatibacterium sediminis]|uniref:PEP-CTERM sorting domain-containing protein n=1 Tax=Alginatibacterium sediminis TaxID=2164068 RepID=A0A420ELJ7_9ALTE|nr:PEP-CTERM sorting domain-containing protein [Alginatibacterium sediminis]RKF21558.1 PEP-CTERM sorting domain-containing protein [Alginatibacterium sediminis]